MNGETSRHRSSNREITCTSSPESHLIATIRAVDELQKSLVDINISSPSDEALERVSCPNSNEIVNYSEIVAGTLFKGSILIPGMPGDVECPHEYLLEILAEETDELGRKVMLHIVVGKLQTYTLAADTDRKTCGI